MSLMSDIEMLWKTPEIVDEITGSPTTDLLAVRYWECNGAAAAFRSYLDIRIPTHRIALTRVLTAPHQLAVERGKQWYGISKDWRLRADTPTVPIICLGPIPQLEEERAVPGTPPSASCRDKGSGAQRGPLCP
ncbi:hypothetical protein IW262DRAFT_1491821 [Armillaria fumosa]|nr:hypothetical protein IW262DRAFT_1491821 [Armillaria fumosa]